MRRINKRKLAIGVLTAGMLIGGVALAEDVWVKTDSVQIRGGKGSIYPVIKNASKGDKLEVTAHEGKWLKVKIDDKEGYVSEDSISSEKIGAGGNAFAGLGLGANSTDLSTGAAGRGLNEQAETYAKGKNLNPKVLDKVIADNKQIDPKEWEAFTAEGKVGPNAR